MSSEEVEHSERCCRDKETDGVKSARGQRWEERHRQPRSAASNIPLSDS